MFYRKKMAGIRRFAAVILAVLAVGRPPLAAEIVIASALFDDRQLTLEWSVQGNDARPARSAALEAKGRAIQPTRQTLAPDASMPACYFFIADTSLSMKSQLAPQVIPVLSTLIDNKLAQHRYGIARFDADLEMLGSFTDDPNALRGHLNSLQAKGQRTELFRSALTGIDELKACSGYRKVLVLLSDGDAEDLPDAYALKDVIEAARERKIALISFGFSDGIKLQNLRRLSEQTGGWLWIYQSDEIVGLAGRLLESTDTGGKLSVKRADLPEKPGELELRLVLSDGRELRAAVDMAPPARPPRWRAWLQQRFPAAPLNVWLIGLAVLAGLTGIALLRWIWRRRGIAADRLQSPAHAFSQPVAIIQSGEDSFVMDRISVNIGALPDNDLVIDDPTVSRRQATIDYKDQSFYLTDRGATNPSQVNGQAVQHCVLANGDILQFGDWRGEFQIIEQSPHFKES